MCGARGSRARPLNVVLVRVDGIGDALVCAPLVAALRAAGHRVGALLTTRNAEAFARGTFAQVHVVERIPWPAHGSTQSSYRRALDDARAARYDVALVASEEPEAYRFARDCGARSRVGFVTGWEKPLKTLWAARRLTRTVVREASAWRARVHEVRTIFRLGAGLHGELAPTRDIARLRPLVSAATGRRDREDAVMLQIARTHREPAGRATFRAIAERVAAIAPATVVASRDDAELATSLATALGLSCRVFDDVAAWRDALACARAVVTPDSGAAHVAGMSGVACVDVFAARPHVAYDVRRWRPWAGPARTLVAGPDPAANAAAVADALASLLARAGTFA
ncbi:MAG: hypothetical protein NVS2B8_11440 [Vulcanimicrobiaceae bacterium]